MRKYIRELHTKPDSHKKRFAFLVSAGCTLAIFSVWSLVRFGAPGATPTVAVAEEDQNAAVLLATDTHSFNDAEDANKEMVTPFENMKSGVANSLSALKNSLNGN